MKSPLIHLTILGVVLLCLSSRFCKAQEEYSGFGMLTRNDLNRIRSLVYKGGACTRINTETIFPQREVDLPLDLVAVYKKDRVGTLRLLLAITVGASPEDARSAGVLALALEEGPVVPLIFLDTDIKTFDSANVHNAPSDREYLIEEVQKALEKAEAAAKKPRKE